MQSKSEGYGSVRNASLYSNRQGTRRYVLGWALEKEKYIPGVNMSVASVETRRRSEKFRVGWKDSGDSPG